MHQGSLQIAIAAGGVGRVLSEEEEHKIKKEHGCFPSRRTGLTKVKLGQQLEEGE